MSSFRMESLVLSCVQGLGGEGEGTNMGMLLRCALRGAWRET